MPIPDYQTLMLPVLRLAAAGEVSIRDCIDRLAKEFKLSDEERAQLLPSGKQTIFANRVHWAKTYMAKAGVVVLTRRGHFMATDRGRALLVQNASRIDNNTAAVTSGARHAVEVRIVQRPLLGTMIARVNTLNDA